MNFPQIYRKQFALRSFNGFVVALAVVIILQIQFGCSLSKFTSAVNSSKSDNTAAANTTQSADSGKDAGNDLSELCRNAFYPVGENVQRKYRIVFAKNVPPPSEHTEKFADFKSDSFTVKNDYGNISTSINWRCTPDGLLGTQFNNSVDINKGSSSDVETLSSSGVTTPIESRWKTGEKWATDYKIKETMKTPSGQKNGEADGTVKQDYEIIGTEDVTVAAGSFQTFKVKLKTVLDLNVKIGGGSVPVKVPLDSTIWFAKDIGVVKTETQSQLTGKATTELLSYSGTK